MLPRVGILHIIVAGAAVLVGCSDPGTNASDAGAADASTPDTPPIDAPVPKKLTFQGVGSGGIFDPSLARDPATGTLWMSYSAVNASPMFPLANKIAANTRLASSSDGGETWVDAGAVNQISDVDLPLAPPLNAGTWMNEVSTLVHDPSAAPGQRWKLMWQTFLKINGQPRYEHSWIALKMAATPEGLAAAPTTKLFTSFLYDTGNSSPAGATVPPLPTTPAIQIDTAVPQLATCIVGEPSLYATAGTLYLSLQCEQFNDPGNATDNDRLITLLSCASPCNVTDPGSWTFVARLFDRATSAAVEPAFDGGYAAPALAETATGVYLLVTPTDDPDALYRGCRAFEFANLATGTLESSAGAPVITMSIDGSTADKFNGACAYLDGSASGIMHSELSALVDGEFQIFFTRRTL